MNYNNDLERMFRIFEECIDEIVDQRVKERPIKTYKQDFLKKFPKAKFDRYNIPDICLCNVYGGRCSETDCVECWNRELKEQKTENANPPIRGVYKHKNVDKIPILFIRESWLNK